MGRWLVLMLGWTMFAPWCRGDDPSSRDASGSAAAGEAESFELSDEVRDAMLPLLKSIAEADVSRATVELSADSVIAGQVVDSQKSTYQIASNAPDQFTIYLKEPDRRTRVYCDGEEMLIAMAPDAYVRAAEPIQTQRAATDLPVPMGPYPEAVLALSLAGVDPAITLLGGMRSVEIIDREPFRGTVPAVHFRGVQTDDVTWDLWVSTDQPPRPLQILVDLTAMLKASDQVDVPPGFAYQLRFDFLSWRMTGDVDPSLFTFTPAADAVEYASLGEYYDSIAGVGAEHPLLGTSAPAFEAVTIDDQRFESKQWEDRTVVVCFWASWCEPCTASVTAIADVAARYAERGVEVYIVSTGETPEKAKAAVQAQGWKATVLQDPSGKIADAFEVAAIPQTVLLGTSGMIEAVHVGFADEAAFRRQLAEQLDVLAEGGTLIEPAAGDTGDAASDTGDGDGDAAGDAADGDGGGGQ